MWVLQRSIFLIGAGAALLPSLLAAPAFARDDVAKLARELARLRGEVESLSTAVETKKSEQRARVRSLATQKADIELQLERERLRLEQVRAREKERTALLARQRAAQKALEPKLVEAAARLEEVIRRGLPFKVAERQRELRQIVEKMEGGLITPEVALARLWERVEDELRLARDSGLYRQVVALEGKEHLVEIARLGMAMLFLRSEAGRYGFAERTGQGWRFRLLDGAGDQARVAKLFESFAKQLRTGWFELPNPLAGLRDDGANREGGS